MNQDSPGIKIRKMKSRELDRVCAIVAKEIYGGADVGEIREWIQAIGRSTGLYTPWYIAENKDSGEVAGCIRYLTFDIDFIGKQVVFEIALLGLDSNYQNRGIGVTLVNASRQLLYKAWAKKGFTPVMLFVETDEENMRARRFYDRVLDKPKRMLIKDLWGTNSGMVFYYQKEREKHHPEGP